MAFSQKAERKFSRALPFAFTRRRFAPLTQDLRMLDHFAQQMWIDGRRGAAAAVTLAAPYRWEGQPRSVVLQPLIFASNRLKDARVAEHRRATERQELFFEVRRTVIGLATNFLLCNDAIGAVHRDRLAEDWNAKLELFRIRDPKQRYKGIYRESSKKQDPKWQYIIPILIEQRVAAVLGLDFFVDLSDVDERKIRARASTLRELLTRVYYSYHAAPPVAQWQDFNDGPDTAKGAVGEIVSGALVTRRYLDQLSRPGQAARWAAPSKRFLVAYCDGDGVKKLNDEYGHAMGNRIIDAYAASLCMAVTDVHNRHIVPHHGLVARWGGDEFILVMPLRGRPQAAIRRLHRRIEQFLAAYVRKIARTSKTKKRRKSPALARAVGLSGGWVLCNTTSRFRDAWSKRAEAAMYVCKALLRTIREHDSKNKTMARKGKPATRRRVQPLVGFLPHSDLSAVHRRLAALAKGGSNGRTRRTSRLVPEQA
jgi:diguanylate cyclase (GGDEF)-like protein